MPGIRNIQCQISNLACRQAGVKYPITWVVLFVIVNLSFIILPSPAFAQSTQVQSSSENVLTSLLNAFAGCMIAGKSLIPNEKCSDEGINFPGNSQSSLLDQRSALGFVGKGISAISTPPLSTVDALADLGQSLGFARPAYAQNVQGSGSRIIAPVKNLWQIIRNITFTFYILLFVTVGLMIMFRQKMNPQTVLSVQSALPGLVIGLVLINFSYLIAAALVDLAFLFIPVIALIFDQASQYNIFIGNREYWAHTPLESANYTSLIDLAQGANIFSFWKAFTLNIALYDFFGNTNQKFGIDPANIIGSLVDTLIELAKNGVNLLIAVSVVFALFFQMLRLLVILIRAYITIMIYTFLGPFLIIMASMPGKGKGLETWWKTILANSLIFPAVFAGFFFGGMMFDPRNIDQNQFQYTLPFFSGLPVQVIKYIIGLMIILGVPAIPGMVKEALGVKDIKGIPEMAMAGFASGAAPVRKLLSEPFDRVTKERTAYRDSVLKSRFPWGDSDDANDRREAARWYVKAFNRV